MLIIILSPVPMRNAVKQGMFQCSGLYKFLEILYNKKKVVLIKITNICKEVGTMEQEKNSRSLSNILTEIYYEQYDLKGLTKYDIDSYVLSHNEIYGSNNRNAIPELTNFIHERRKWFEEIISALIDDEAYEILKMGKKDFSFSDSKAIKDFLSSIFSNDSYFVPLRRNIMRRKYFEISEEDVEILRFWIQTLYEDVECNKEDIEKILKIFDAHFSLKFREIQKELNILMTELSENSITLFSEEDYEDILNGIRGLTDVVRSKMKW